MTSLRSLSFLVAYSFRRQARSRRLRLALVLLALGGLAVGGAGVYHPWTVARFTRSVVLGLYGSFFLPLGALLVGNGALGADREEGTLLYLLARPLSRMALYLGKFLAALPLVAAFSLGTLWLMCRAGGWTSGREIGDAFGLYWRAGALAGLAYLALFQLLGALLRHGIAVSLAYVFFIELFVGRVPGILKRVSISFYEASIVYARGAPHGVRPPHRAIFLPVGEEAATWALLGIAAALLAAGAWLFARREHLPSRDS